ncbi:hypothetical protein MPER_05740, partial [Moniliophthora perniciosa FA553]
MFLLYALAHPILADAVMGSNQSMSAADPKELPCNDIHQCRTSTDILRSCYSVILLSTWLAIHPNVPSVHVHSAVGLAQWFLVMLIALLAPEFMVLWAMRQWVSCRRIHKKYQEYAGWTKCHAFLVLMGGLALYNDGEFVCYLWDRDRLDSDAYIDERRQIIYRSGEPGVVPEIMLAVTIEKGLGGTNATISYGAPIGLS